MNSTRAEVPPSLDGGGTQMSDLQMTKLCAKAMGFIVEEVLDGIVQVDQFQEQSIDSSNGFSYDPLHDHAQAMALVKKMNLTIIKMGLYPGWHVTYREPAHGEYQRFRDVDLNRAIVVCVAKVQFDRTAREASAEATNK